MDQLQQPVFDHINYDLNELMLVSEPPREIRSASDSRFHKLCELRTEVAQHVLLQLSPFVELE